MPARSISGQDELMPKAGWDHGGRVQPELTSGRHGELPDLRGVQRDRNGGRFSRAAQTDDNSGR